MNTELVLVRYGEIALKSKPVRKWLIQKLKENIITHFSTEKLECYISSDYGRIYLYCDDLPGAIHVLKRVFGIVSFSMCTEISSELDQMKKETTRLAGSWLDEGMSFAVRTRRIGTHTYSSQSLAEELGAAILQLDRNIKVDLEHPDVEVFVEVRHDKAFVYNSIVKAPGGLPLGSQGLVLAYVENKNDLVAAWLMMKRGCKVDVAHTKESSSIGSLKAWDPRIRFHECADLDGFLNLSDEINADGIVLGWNLKKALKEKLKHKLPIFYPLVGLGDHEMDEMRDTVTNLKKHPD